jgi:Glycosyl hydrolases family 18
MQVFESPKFGRRALLLATLPSALLGCVVPVPSRVVHPQSPLPAKVLACYYAAWDTRTFRISDVPMDFNAIYLFHAKPNGPPVDRSWINVGDGSFRFDHHAEVTASQVQRCRVRGQKVILTVGGERAGFNFDNRDKSRNFVDSFRAMYDAFGGLDGCDFNNFEAKVGSSPAEMIWIAQQLKSLYGPHFAITAPPEPNSLEDRAMLKAMADAGVLSWAAPQFYGWPGFNAAGFISNRTGDWVRDLGADKVVLGLAANYANGPSLQDCIREWETVRGRHPGIRGMFCWNAQFNLAGGNTWGKMMKARL